MNGKSLNFMKDRPRASHVAPEFSAVFWSFHYSNWPFLVSAMARTKQTARKIQTDTENLSWYLDNSLNLHIYENEDLEQKKEWGKVEQMAGKYLQEKGEKVNLVTFFRSGGLGICLTWANGQFYAADANYKLQKFARCGNLEESLGKFLKINHDDTKNFFALIFLMFCRSIRVFSSFHCFCIVNCSCHFDDAGPQAGRKAS